ncbi:MAG: hypothetical protein RIC06_15550 [Cyclobacteriaceae bacterium]
MGFRSKYWGVKAVSKLKTFDPRNNFYIFSDPRGGSTWLAELIQAVPSSAILWEPLHLEYNRIFRDLGFQWRQYIPEDEAWVEARKAFDRHFEGKEWNIFSSQMTYFSDLLFAERLLVKICRGNRLLPWLTKQYEFKYKPIYMIRHPFAVVDSQLKQGGWDANWKSFKLPDSPYVDFELKHADFLGSLESKEELLTANWCISNKQTLENVRHGVDWINVKYESLFLNPEDNLKIIFDQWNLELPDKIDFSKNSRTSLGTYTKDKMKQLSKWKTHFDSQQIDQMLRVVDYFQIKQYSDAVLPEIC